jgi:TPR repeat protein
MFSQNFSLSMMHELQQQGMMCIQNRDYDKAEEYFLEINNANAFFHLGHMYAELTSPDYVKAKEYYEKAAEGGNVYAMINLGVMYFFGKGMPTDPKMALKYFLNALEEKPREGLISYHLGVIHQFGAPAVPVDLLKALDYYKAAIKYGYAKEGMRKIAVVYALGGPKVTRNYELAFYYFLQAANNGDIYSLYFVGFFYSLGRGVPKNLVKAFEYYLLAADNGHSIAQLIVGERYENGVGVLKNLPKAIDYYQKSQNKQAWVNLGKIFQHSNDFPKAIYYYRKAADKNHRDAVKWFQTTFNDIAHQEKSHPHFDLLLYHAAMATDELRILIFFEKQFLTRLEKLIHLLEENPQDNLAQLQKKFSPDFFQKITAEIQQGFIYKFFTIMQSLQISDLTKITMGYLMEESFIKTISYLNPSHRGL